MFGLKTSGAAGFGGGGGGGGVGIGDEDDPPDPPPQLARNSRERAPTTALENGRILIMNRTRAELN